MDVLADRILDLSHHVVHELSILRLQEENVVGRVDQAVPRHLFGELVWHVTLDARKEAANDLLVLVLHLHVVDFGDEHVVIVAVLYLRHAKKQTLVNQRYRNHFSKNGQ